MVVDNAVVARSKGLHVRASVDERQTGRDSAWCCRSPLIQGSHRTRAAAGERIAYQRFIEAVPGR